MPSNTKISDLSPVASLDGTEEFAVVQSAQTLKATVDQAFAGRRTLWVPAAAMRPRVTNGCGSLQEEAGSANQPDLEFLAFDAAAIEYARFSLSMPKSWDEGDISAKFVWRRASGVSAADVVWAIRALARSNGDDAAASFSTYVVGGAGSVTSAAGSGPSIVILSSATGDLTIAGTPAVEDLVFFEVLRVASNAADTLAVDAHLIGVALNLNFDKKSDD